MTPVAHGVGTRADLPVPVTFVVIGAAIAVLTTFLALGVLWPRPRLRGDAGGIAIPVVVQRVLDSTVLRVLLRLLALAATTLVLTVALVGPADPPANIAPWAFFITFWVGLVPASLLLGPVWRVLNPLRALHKGLAALTGTAPGEDRLARMGYWPAAASLLAFGWFELAYPERSTPSKVGTFVIAYSVVQLLAALWFGAGWFARGDGFEVYSTLLARLSPLGRREDGRLVLRSPLDGAAGLSSAPGLAAVVVVLVGTTAFDGLTRTTYWQNGPGISGDARSLPQLLGLTLVVALVAALYAGATTVAGRVAGVPDGPSAYAHTVIPIAAGYAIAHYFSLLLLDGQLTYILASDPFQRGVDLFGTAANAVDYTAVRPRTISVVQVTAIVLGHVLGVVLAHDRAVRLSSGRTARTSQYPLLLVMVVFTVGGLLLLLGG